jgi:carbon monoxide dehydrogenase subunit G
VTVKRQRTVAAAPGAVWALVSDPHHLPRWWPQVQRVEEVEDDAWTKVLRTPRGKTVRADYTRVSWRPPHEIVWRQEVEESPFEAILDESITTIALEPAGEGETRVELQAEQELHGSYRFGGFMLRRATRKQLDEALDGIERAVAA